MNEGFGKDFYRKGNSVKRSVNRRTLKTEKLLSSSPSRRSALINRSGKLTRTSLKAFKGVSKKGPF